MCMICIGSALVDIGLWTPPARLVPDELLARVFGAAESLTAMSVALGSFVTPFAIELLGIRGALAVLGLIGPGACRARPAATAGDRCLDRPPRRGGHGAQPGPHAAPAADGGRR